MNLKHLIVSFFLISTITNCFELERQYSKEQLMQKIRDEYEESCNSQNCNDGFVLVKDNDSILFKTILEVAGKMNIKIAGPCLFIIKGSDESASVYCTYDHYKLEFLSFYFGELFIKKTNYAELKEVIAHELAHKKFNHSQKIKQNYKIFKNIFYLPALIALLTILKKPQNEISTFFVDFILALSISQILNFVEHINVLQSSRQQEYEADEQAVKFSKDKNILINYFRKRIIENDYFGENKNNKSLIDKLCIKLKELRSTHPTYENRIKAIENMKI